MFGNTFANPTTPSSPAPSMSQGAAASNPNNDYDVPDVSADGISSVHFSPVSDHFLATSWDCTVRIWEYGVQKPFFGSTSPGSIQCTPKAMQQHSEPILCSAFNREGRGVFFGGTDGQVKLWDLGANQVQQVAQHEQGVKELAFLGEQNILLTGSWDKRLCYWDCRSSNPAHAQMLPERVCAMDVKGQLLVVATAQRHVQVFDLRNPSAPRTSQESPLKWQTRCVACFSDEKGYFIGSIEGRCGVQNIDAVNAAKNFTFKCHRQGEPRSTQEIFAVNAIKVHPQFGTFITCGSDGVFHFWDKESKRRLKPMQRCRDSISCADFNRDGSLVAYAVSYDWRFGVEGYHPENMRSQIFLHQVQESDVRPGASALANRRR